MSDAGRDYFRLPGSLKTEYRRWPGGRFEGWVEGELFDSLSPEQVSHPGRLFKLPGTRVVRDRRNLTAQVSIGGRLVWIKRFRPSGKWDRFIYSRGPGKAVFAWNAAMALTARGFCTPMPLIGLRRTGKDGGAEGMVAFENLAGNVALDQLLADGPGNSNGEEKLMYELGACLRRFHGRGFRHRDLRQGNILAARADGAWTFCFLDLNRLRVQGPLSRVQRLREIEKLNLPPDHLPSFFDAYMPDENSAHMAELYRDRVDFADHLEHLPQGRLIRKAWYYAQELRAFSFARRP